MRPTSRELAEALGARLIGDGHVEVTGVASISSASASDVVFVEEQKNIAAALESQAAAIIAGDFAGGAKSSKALIITSSPRLAFARAAAMLGDSRLQGCGIHSTAFVHASAKLGQAVSIDAHVSVGEGAQIGDHTSISAGSVIGAQVTIGNSSWILPNVIIYPGTQIGNRVIIHGGAVLGSDGFGYVRDTASGRYEKFPQIGKLVIEDDVEIGANTTIDRGALEVTHIGRGTKIDNLVHIGHNCQIGENVIIAAQAGFSGSITVEDNAVIGGQVGVGEHARIQEGVMLGGQAGVLPKKILRGKGVAFWGTPAKPLREYLKSLAALARLGKKEV
jgi:UDP-3-O-[3-hydroxymyristoyl] glucosamine N-acyltransferase